MSYWQRLKRQLGIDFQDAKPALRDGDVTINVATGGVIGQTVSMRAALGARQGIWRWCLFCRLLDVLVQRNHCAQTLDPNAVVPTSVYWRAALSFGGAAVLIVVALVVLIHWSLALGTTLFAAAIAGIAQTIRGRPGRRADGQV